MTRSTAASTREGTALTLATRLGYTEIARLLAGDVEWTCYSECSLSVAVSVPRIEAKFGAPLSPEKSLLLRKFGVSPEEKVCAHTRTAHTQTHAHTHTRLRKGNESKGRGADAAQIVMSATCGEKEGLTVVNGTADQRT